MISFKKLGEYGRFGNQLFQYAFLRTQAKKLGVRFYCPAWLGEKVFLLDDESEKVSNEEVAFSYQEDPYQHGFNQSVNTIQDRTDVEGYFQSWKFFNKDDVARWFIFNEDLFKGVREKYASIDFNKCIALHVRLGDYAEGSLMFYTPTPQYFKDACKLLGQGRVVVFSEDVTKVKQYLGDMPKDTVFIEGNKDYEDFYLMTLCRDNVISPSSFSWWAAYLNKNPEKRVIMPKYWYIPFSRVINNDLRVEGWVQIKGHNILKDNYYYRYIRSLFI